MYEKLSQIRILIFVSAFLILLASCSPVRKYAATSQKWEPAMQKFDSLNEAENYADDAILFTGSSSIRLWSSLEEDMASYPVIQRAYGGAPYGDLAYYIDRIIKPNDFDAIVLFAGNDI